MKIGYLGLLHIDTYYFPTLATILKLCSNVNFFENMRSPFQTLDIIKVERKKQRLLIRNTEEVICCDISEPENLRLLSLTNF